MKKTWVEGHWVERDGERFWRKGHFRINKGNNPKTIKKSLEGSKKDKDKEKEEFLKEFKDTRKQKKESKQTNLDKQLGINTKLYEEYGDLKAFDKKQKRLK
jgi:hypothetical protein